jgi:hypothetical protein
MTSQPGQPGGHGRHGEHASVSGTRGWLTKPSWLLVPAWLTRWARWSARRRWVVIAASASAFLGLGAGLTYVAISGGTGPAARLRPTAGTSPNPDSTHPVPRFNVPAQVDPVALPSTGAVPLPTYEQPQVKSWQAGPGGAALKQVSDQAGNVTQAEGLKQYVEMKAACTQLAISVTTAQDAPPIPDAALQSLYQKALGELGTGAGQCKTAIFEEPEGEEYVATTENTSALRAAALALKSGSRNLFLATSQIATLGQN